MPVKDAVGAPVAEQSIDERRGRPATWWAVQDLNL
jgi:hypothetical protein